MNRIYLARGDSRFGTSRHLESFLEEERASGSLVETAAGPWKTGAIVCRRAAEDRLDVLPGDDGVMLWFRSQGLDVPALLDFARAATQAVRGPEYRQVK